MPLSCPREAFEAMVTEALESIPLEFRRRMENVDVAVEWDFPDDLRRDLKLPPRDDLLGLYQGWPLTRRGADYGNALPDKITIYQRPLLDFCQNLEQLREEIRKVVWHEVGHYFGLDDATLHRLEQKRLQKGRTPQPPKHKNVNPRGRREQPGQDSNHGAGQRREKG